MEMFKNVATECAKKEGATSADVDDTFSKKLPATTSAKCMHACIGETIGAVSQMIFKNNPINFDSLCESISIKDERQPNVC